MLVVADVQRAVFVSRIPPVVEPENVGTVVGVYGCEVTHQFGAQPEVPVQGSIQVAPAQAVLCLFLINALSVPVCFIVGCQCITAGIDAEAQSAAVIDNMGEFGVQVVEVVVQTYLLFLRGGPVDPHHRFGYQVSPRATHADVQ